MPENEFEWVKVQADAILGDARPKDVGGLLKRKGVWHQLYREWLTAFHPDGIERFEFLVNAGGRPRLQGRQRYDQNLAALDKHFGEFYTEVGELKQALDDRTGSARRLARLTGKAASAAQDVARSGVVTSMAKSVGAEPLQKLAANAAGRVGTAVAPSGPQSIDAGPEPEVAAVAVEPEPVAASEYENAALAAAHWFAATPDLDTYLEWLAALTEDFSWFGGRLGEHAGWLATTAQDIASWRQELSTRLTAEADLASVREAVYWTAYHVDLLAYPSGGELPHQAAAALVDELTERSAFAVYHQVRPRLEELLEHVGSAYYYGGLALDHAASVIAAVVPGYPGDAFEPWAQHQLSTYRGELSGHPLPSATDDATPTEADEAAAMEFFGRPLDQLG
jgi:hypothetical protein